MFLHNFSTFFSSPSREECSISTETPQFSLENESNPELNYTKYINLDFSDEEKRQSLSDFPKKTEETPNENRNSSGFFKPIFSNLQDFVASQLSQSNYSRLLEKSKRIIKRENAKKRVKLAKQQKPVEKREESQEICEKNEEKTCKKQEICKTSDKEIKKIVQKLRNRISAQQSRDRKKQYLESLERENANLQREIQQLRGEKVGNEEKKLNPLGILKLGMTFLSMFMIIVGGKEKLGDNKGIVIGENVIGDNNLGRSLWGLDENRGKNEEIIRDILMKMKIEGADTLFDPGNIITQGHPNQEQINAFLGNYLDKQGISLSQVSQLFQQEHGNTELFIKEFMKRNGFLIPKTQ